MLQAPVLTEEAMHRNVRLARLEVERLQERIAVLENNRTAAATKEPEEATDRRTPRLAVARAARRVPRLRGAGRRVRGVVLLYETSYDAMVNATGVVEH
jgi:hypothetical protein